MTTNPIILRTLMARCGRSVVRYRRIVLVFWLAVVLAGLAGIGRVESRLSSSETLPGLPSFTVSQAILQRYGTGGDNPPVIVVLRLPAGQQVESPAGRAELDAALAPLTRDRSLRVASYANTGDRSLVARDDRTTVALAFGGSGEATSMTLAARVRSAAPAGLSVSATSYNDLQNGSKSAGFGVLAETVFGGIGALVILGLVFGSLLALVPLVVAIVSILTTFVLIGVVTDLTTVSVLVEYLIALIGLGIAIDYSLLVVTRWREERGRGRSNEEAVVAAVATAGRAVAFSGLTVGIGLLALVALPVPFLRSLGYAGILIPFVSVVVALTVLPAVLSTIGPRLEWPHRRRVPPASRTWSSWTRAVVRHRVLSVVAALTVLGVLIGVTFGVRVGEVQPSSLATSGPAATGFATLRHDGFPTGLLDPVEVLVPDGENLAALARRLSGLPGAYTVVAPAGSSWRRDGTALLDVVPHAATTAAGNTALVRAIRHELPAIAPHAAATGDSLIELDWLHVLYGRAVIILLFVALVSLLVLGIAFRSIALALKALVLDVCSIGATMGALVLFWQRGFGSRPFWGIPATGAIVDFVPLVTFAFLFGLSMDYEVFIVSRIREEHDAGRATNDAVVTGMSHTGRLVTSAAAVLVLAFVALASGPVVSLKMFATALAIGILLDATVVRSLLVPAFISLLGERSWWLPGRKRTRAQTTLAEETMGTFPVAQQT
ncbi:MAG: MMPL family transporter [Acidimicrobiales bacterium]